MPNNGDRPIVGAAAIWGTSPDARGPPMWFGGRTDGNGSLPAQSRNEDKKRTNLHITAFAVAALRAKHEQVIAHDTRQGGHQAESLSRMRKAGITRQVYAGEESTRVIRELQTSHYN
jgi:hypothetical protein